VRRTSDVVMRMQHGSVVVTVGVMVLVASGCGADGPDTVAPSSSTSSIAPSTTAVTTTGATTSPPIDVTTLPPTMASSTTAVPTSAPAPSAWVPQDLGEEPGDSEAVAATNGSTTVLVAGFEAGEARAWVSDRRGEFSSAEIERTDDETLWIHDVVAFDEGFVAVGNGYPTFVPRLWRSADGSAWELVPPTGLSEPADIQRLLLDACRSGCHWGAPSGR
jgi:hypothetical protein